MLWCCYHTCHTSIGDTVLTASQVFQYNDICRRMFIIAILNSPILNLRVCFSGRKFMSTSILRGQYQYHIYVPTTGLRSSAKQYNMIYYPICCQILQYILLSTCLDVWSYKIERKEIWVNDMRNYKSSKIVQGFVCTQQLIQYKDMVFSL